MCATPNTIAYVADLLMQPDSLRRVRMRDVSVALVPLSRSINAYRRIILTGMGSSHAALRPLWLTLVEAGITAWRVDSAECLGHCLPLVDDNTLVIAASQSGRSAELVALSGEAKLRGGSLLAITNDSDSPLARNADAVIDIGAGVEMAVSTKTYLNTLAVGVMLGRIFLDLGEGASLDRVADAIDAYLTDWRNRVERMKETAGLPERLYFLARGSSLAAAEYGALIVKEAARWPVEAQSVPQFRHGPLELADPRLTVVLLSGSAGRAREHNLVLHGDLKKYGARSLWLDTGSEDAAFSIPACDDDLRPILEVLPLQLFSIALAEQSGVTPGEFRHLTKVTTVL